MTLSALQHSLDFNRNDIYGESISLNNLKGKKILLSFFRDATCPFCHSRLYELTFHQDKWKDQNLEVIAVFTSSNAQVLRHVAKKPRPFRMIADPELTIYQQYGVQKSIKGMMKGMLFKMNKMLKGFLNGGSMATMLQPHSTIIPADFLINEQGIIEQVWYGEDPSDHIPMDDINDFAKR